MASHADVRIVVLILASVKWLCHYPFHRQAIFIFTVFHNGSKSAKVHQNKAIVIYVCLLAIFQNCYGTTAIGSLSSLKVEPVVIDIGTVKNANRFCG